jgi:hypothetical protein
VEELTPILLHSRPHDRLEHPGHLVEFRVRGNLQWRATRSLLVAIGDLLRAIGTAPNDGDMAEVTR